MSDRRINDGIEASARIVDEAGQVKITTVDTWITYHPDPATAVWDVKASRFYHRIIICTGAIVGAETAISGAALITQGLMRLDEPAGPILAGAGLAMLAITGTGAYFIGSHLNRQRRTINTRLAAAKELLEKTNLAANPKAPSTPQVG